MPRCSNCQRFVSIDEDEPTPEATLNEVEHVDGDALISGEIRIANACAECQTELAEYTFELETAITVMHEGYTDECEMQASGDLQRDMKYEGRGRGMKTFYGYTGPISVSCETHGGKEVGEKECSDYVQASGMDSLE